MLSETEAARLTQRIELRLSTIADNTEAVIPMIEEARTGGAHEALGFPSWTAYVSDKFGGALARLGKADRLPFVELMADQGLSTRAIATVVGVSKDTVSRDLRAGVSNETPDETTDDFAVMGSATEEEFEVAIAEAKAEGDLSRENVENKVVTAKKNVTGIDGKTYTRPEPKKSPRRPITDRARDIGWDLEKVVNRINRLPEDDRFTRNKEAVAQRLRPYMARSLEMLTGAMDVLPGEAPSDELRDSYRSAVADLAEAVRRIDRLTKDERFCAEQSHLQRFHMQRMVGLQNTLDDCSDQLAGQR